MIGYRKISENSILGKHFSLRLPSGESGAS